ncbi:MAG: YafY family protein [Chloroflexota bacterium]
MRADRLLSIILLLQRHHQMTAQALAQSLGVSERTIYRDIDALSLAGIPVYTKSGPDGGCYLDSHYRGSLNWFTGAELQALLFTGTASPLADLGMASVMDNAVLKLLSLIPERRQAQADLMRQRLYLDSSSWYGETDSTMSLADLKEATWNDLIIEVHYINWNGHEQSRRLAPYSLVYKSNRWYLVAKNLDSEEMRTYRVGRITDVHLTNEIYERDATFDIVAHWETASEAFTTQLPEYPVRLRVKIHMLSYFQTVFIGRFDIIEQSEEWLTLDVQYSVFEEALSSVLGLGADVEVIEPLALHDAVLRQAQAILEKWSAS